MTVGKLLILSRGYNYTPWFLNPGYPTPIETTRSCKNQPHICIGTRPLGSWLLVHRGPITERDVPKTGAAQCCEIPPLPRAFSAHEEVSTPQNAPVLVSWAAHFTGIKLYLGRTKVGRNRRFNGGFSGRPLYWSGGWRWWGISLMADKGPPGRADGRPAPRGRQDQYQPLTTATVRYRHNTCSYLTDTRRTTVFELLLRWN